MYSIYADNNCIYNDAFALDSQKIINPKLSLEDSSSGSLSITLPSSNIGYDTIVRMVSDIIVRKKNIVIWEGRVLSENKDFHNNRVLYCEGALAYLNDSTQPPHEYPSVQIREYLECLLEVHNSKVSTNRRITLGVVTVNDQNFTTRYTNYEKTLECVNNLVEECGGHVRIRYENDSRYLDYLEDAVNTNTQIIQFGKNLLDFTRKWDASEFATVIVPLGNRLDESAIPTLDAYLTVESVNNRSIYVQSDDAVAEYGWIERTITWDDVSDAETLLVRAQQYLKDLQFETMEIELSALDLYYLNSEIESINLLDKVRVCSRPHGLDRVFTVLKMDIPLDRPEQTKFSLGDRVQTGLTQVNNQTRADILANIERTRKTVLDKAKENATSLMNMATNGYISIVKNQNGSEALYISDTQDFNEATRLWKWNVNGLGYWHWETEDTTSDTYNLRFGELSDPVFGIAMTMDGSICADYITTGNLSADRIRTGCLQDEGGNTVFDLETGTLTIKKGSISIGAKYNYDHTFSNGAFKTHGTHANFEVDSDGNMWAKNAVFYGDVYANNGIFGGELTAASGTFKGEIWASDFKTYDGISLLTMDKSKIDAESLSLYGLKIFLKKDGVKTKDISFEVSSNGVISLGPSTVMKWSANNSPVRALYACSKIAKPDKTYDDPHYVDDSASGWHKKLNVSSDFYVSYSYDGGNTWSDAIALQGKNGKDGVSGTNATVTYDKIISELQRANNISSACITADSVGAPILYGGKIYGPEIYAGSGVGGSGQMIMLTEFGIQLKNSYGADMIYIHDAGDGVARISSQGTLNLSAENVTVATNYLKVSNASKSSLVDFSEANVTGLYLRFSP